jgi:hypothetical protein
MFHVELLRCNRLLLRREVEISTGLSTGIPQVGRWVSKFNSVNGLWRSSLWKSCGMLVF